MPKRIKVKFFPDNRRAQITEQTHRGITFGQQGEFFLASNGFRFESSSYPDTQLGCHSPWHGIFVRGSDAVRDDQVFIVPGRPFRNALKKAVEEYNAYFANHE